MYRISLFFGIILSYLLYGSLVLAADALHFKNGNVIKGEVIEHNLVAKKYKIQISDGSILTFSEDELIKIVKIPESKPSQNNTIIKNKPEIVIDNKPRKTQHLPHYDYHSSSSVIVPFSESVQAKEKKYFQVFYGTFSVGYTVPRGLCRHTPNCHSADEILTFDGDHLGISLSLSNHLTLKYSAASFRYDSDSRLWQALLASNALEEGWNLQLGYSRLTDVHTLSGVALGLEYHFENISIGLMGTYFNSGYEHTNINFASSGEFNIAIRF
jgi:hypothetical protein